jgi:hypothetical protein
MKTPSPGLVIRWMSFAAYGDRLLSLRRQVFMEQQGYGEDFIRTPDGDERQVMAVTGQEALRKQCFDLRSQHEALSAQLGLRSPLLARFRDDRGRKNLIPQETTGVRFSMTPGTSSSIPDPLVCRSSPLRSVGESWYGASRRFFSIHVRLFQGQSNGSVI